MSWGSPVQGGTAVDSQVPLQLGQRGEVQPALHTYILLPLFMLQLMCTKFAGISKASTTHTAAGDAGTAKTKKVNEIKV